MRRYGRLRRAGEIAFVRRKGRVFTFATMSAFAAPDKDGSVRVGIVASKAVGGAVVRNLVKRRIRGALDGLATTPSTRILFVAQPAAARFSYAQLAADVAAAVARSSGAK